MLTLGFVGTVSDGTLYPCARMPKWMFHDASVAVVCDGEVQFALEEERCSRIKHTNHFPRQALRRALEHVGIRARDVDVYAFPFSEDFVERELQLFHIAAGSSDRPQARSEIVRLISDAVGDSIEPAKLVFLDHHRCHAAAVWAKSGYDHTLIIVMDGSGERESISVFKASNQKLLRLAAYSIKQSLGHFYSGAIQLLGFDLFDEYKVMGLAPFGREDALAEIFSKTYVLQADGQYELRADFQRFFLDAGFPARSPGEPLLDAHRDFASALQRSLEHIANHIVKYWMTLTSSRNLCLSGGVAQNCVMTASVARLECVDSLFVDPSAHDAGATIGAAFLTNDVAPKALTHSFLGPGLPRDLRRHLDGWCDVVEFVEVEDIVTAAAEMLFRGSILAWVCGRSEFGPRALGHRSILAAPGPKVMRDRVNALVKEREQFRPLAPVVTQEDCHRFFELPSSIRSSPYMNTVGIVKPEARGLLAAVTHFDGTARVQTVSSESDAKLHSLLCHFESLYGAPVLLNTSLNNRYEPIADSVDEALTCLITMGLDAMIVGDFVVTVRNLLNLENFFCSLPAGVVLRQDLAGGSEGVVNVGPVLEKFLEPTKFRQISLGTAELLRARVPVSLARVAPAQLDEIKELWRSRHLNLRPAPAQ